MQPTTTIGDAVSPSLLATAGERCSNCDARMAGDQRYCTECGERRGQPRLPFMDGRTRPATAIAATPAAPARRARPSSSTALLAGIATLLLAMGVGVLIGESGNDSPSAAKAPAVQVVSVPGAAAAPAATAATTTPTDGTTGSTGSAAAKGSGTASSGASKTSSAAAKPTTAAKPKTGKVVKLGDKGTGKGFKNGKFTGDFFGG